MFLYAPWFDEKAEEGRKEKGLANGVKAERGRENPKKTSTHARISERGKQRSEEEEHKCKKNKQFQAVIRVIQ